MGEAAGLAAIVAKDLSCNPADVEPFQLRPVLMEQDFVLEPIPTEIGK
jgi:hypothetical protein